MQVDNTHHLYNQIMFNLGYTAHNTCTREPGI